MFRFFRQSFLSFFVILNGFSKTNINFILFIVQLDDDCSDASDEFNCSKIFKYNEFFNNKKINLIFINKLKQQQQQQKAYAPCSMSEFTCSNKRCIHLAYVCDGKS